jgi:RNA polymerase sigma-70 factor (ECF subfamily)
MNKPSPLPPAQQPAQMPAPVPAPTPPSPTDPLRTHASMFERLKTGDAPRRELEWQHFRVRYAPVVAGFARNLGVRPQDVDDVIQDVFLGFFSVSSRFPYDPSKGRFRGYLKTVTVHAIRARFRRARVQEVPLEDVADDAPALAEGWDRAWAEHVMRRAVEATRAEYAAHPKTFAAFERYALQCRPAAEVAAELGMPVASVYQAKSRVLDVLRAKVKAFELED